MYVEKINITKSNVTFIELEAITDLARLASEEFFGMGFEERTLILKYASKPIQIARIVEEITFLVI